MLTLETATRIQTDPTTRIGTYLPEQLVAAVRHLVTAVATCERLNGRVWRAREHAGLREGRDLAREVLRAIPSDALDEIADVMAAARKVR